MADTETQDRPQTQQGQQGQSQGFANPSAQQMRNWQQGGNYPTNNGQSSQPQQQVQQIGQQVTDVFIAAPIKAAGLWANLFAAATQLQLESLTGLVEQQVIQGQAMAQAWQQKAQQIQNGFR